MVLKRKRSESEFSISSSSTFNSPTKPEQSFIMMDMDVTSMHRFSRNTTPNHLPSRTLKRFRDSRPSDEEVHRKFYAWRAHHQASSAASPAHASIHAERTLNMLYSSQKQHLPSDSLTTQPQPQPATTTQPQGSQASLHNFWKLPSAPRAVPPTDVVVPTPVDRPTSCEDCGQTLREGRGDEDSMDMDGFGTDTLETGCVTCGKHVCSHCSITDLVPQRRCLICAGKKVWVGGLGWAGIAGLKVC